MENENTKSTFSASPIQQVYQANPVVQPVAVPVPPPITPQAPVQNQTSFQPPQEKKSPIKKILKILLLLIIVFGFIGLIFYALTNFSTGSKSISGQVKLTYWGLFEDSSTMQSVLSDFEKENPKISVEYVKQDPKNYRERLNTRIANGDGPDIFRFHNTWYPMISGLLLPLPTSVISKEEFARNYYPVVQNDLIKNGAIYGIPLEMDTLALFINTQLFQSAGLSRPVTWNDFITASRQMTVKDADGKIKTAGAAIGTYDNVSHAADILSLLFLQNGVDFKNIAGSSDRIQGALNFYTSFATDQGNIWDNTLDPSILAFSKGNLGMMFGYYWDYFTVKQFNPNLNFQIVPVPQLPNQNVTLASYWAEGVSAKSNHQKEALTLIKYLARKDVSQKLYASQSKTRGFGDPYARIDLADSLKNSPDFYTFVSQAPDANSSFFVDSSSDNGLNQDLNTYLANAVNVLFKNGTLQDAFDILSKGISDVYQKYGL